MDKLHITQDDDAFWMLSLERENGDLSLLAHRFSTPDHLIENANELVATGKVKAIVLIDPPREGSAARQAASADENADPAPRKTGA
jgi:hypothetical protein